MTAAIGDADRPDRVRVALRWIGARLEEESIPYQVAGGLAAIAHGASRPLNDIDIYVPDGSLERLRSTLEGHRYHGPRRYRDEQWDCYFMEVSYAGEEIELAEAGRTRYRKDPDHAWHAADVDFSAPEIREVFGLEIPVMSRERLMEYKGRLDRAVDREDLAGLTSGG